MKSNATTASSQIKVIVNIHGRSMIDIERSTHRSGKWNQTDRDVQQGHEIKKNMRHICSDQALEIGIEMSTIESIKF